MKPIKVANLTKKQFYKWIRTTWEKSCDFLQKMILLGKKWFYEEKVAILGGRKKIMARPQKSPKLKRKKSLLYEKKIWLYEKKLRLWQKSIDVSQKCSSFTNKNCNFLRKSLFFTPDKMH